MTAVPTPDEILSALRADIDRIDAGMHALLIERGDIIEQLIAVKARQGGGSAFRPGREAEMMRRIAERHRGPLPLDTVESIWRVIIATFTYVQAPYAVHAALGRRRDAMRDSARFHFGFTVPLVSHDDATGVVRAVRKGAGDLGLIAADPADHDPWWYGLREPDAPKIIARLPFVERTDHPAGLPVYVIAPPQAAAAARDILLFAVSIQFEDPDGGVIAPHPDPDFAALGATILARAGDEWSCAWLVAVRAEDGARLTASFGEGVNFGEVGSHAARYTFDATASA